MDFIGKAPVQQSALRGSAELARERKLNVLEKWESPGKKFLEAIVYCLSFGTVLLSERDITQMESELSNAKTALAHASMGQVFVGLKTYVEKNPKFTDYQITTDTSRPLTVTIQNLNGGISIQIEDPQWAENDNVHAPVLFNHQFTNITVDHFLEELALQLDDIEKLYFSDKGVRSLLALLPIDAIERTVCSIVNGLCDMKNSDREISVNEGEGTIKQMGEKGDEKKLHISFGGHLIEIPHKNLIELRQDLYLDIFMAMSRDEKVVPESIKNSYLALDQTYKAQDELRKTELQDNISSFPKPVTITGNNGKPFTDTASVPVSLTGYRYEQTKNGSSYGGIPGWNFLQHQFDKLKGSPSYSEKKTVVDCITLENGDFKYDWGSYPATGESKLRVHVSIEKMEDYFKTCQWLMKTKQISTIKLYFNDPSDPHFYQEGKCTILFYVDNFHDRDELDRVRNIMVDNGFIKKEDQTEVLRSKDIQGNAALNEVAFRYNDPNWKIDEERFGKMSRRSSSLSHDYI
ncbi:MAG: hypothetical protein K0R08_868 [Solimicrobium sp.]|jgi:hypothetical protein|nr:hypothetical protein [Solimicrobium sp.]